MDQTFRVRLNCIDYYRVAPTKYDPILRKHVRSSQLSKEPEVPVVRVFGSTPAGQKVCAHIHGVLPYMFVEYTDSLAPEVVGAYVYQLHLSIDHALAASYRRTNAAKPPRFVGRITLVKAVPFYGFHVGYRFYLKIYMLNPLVMTRLADMLQQGLIMNRKFQPYESHLQYLLQFMTDYNLYGCAYIDATNVAFRAPVPHYDADEVMPHHWHSQSIPVERRTDDANLPRVSHCALEVDICVQDILNRNDVHERRLHHDFVERIHPQPADIKLVHSMAGLWKDEAKRRKRRMAGKDAKSSPFAPEALVSMSADPRHSQPPGWIHEEEYREQIREQIEQEARVGRAEPSFDGFVQRQPYEETVKTVLQSVEDLYPENLLHQLGLDAQYPEAEDVPDSSVVVDEKGILNFGTDDGTSDIFPYESDDDDLDKAKIVLDMPEEPSEGKSGKGKLESGGVNVVPSGTLNSSGGTKGHGRGSGLETDGEVPSGIDNRVLSGVCRSGLGTGRPPQFSVTAELVAELMSDGLVSKLVQGQDGQRDLVPDKPTFKRHHEVVDDVPRVKRHKSIHGLELDSHVQTTQSNFAASSRVGQEEDLQTAREINKKATTAQRKKADTDKDDRKGRGNRTLSFTVVKDPNDPHTRLRLSQLSGGSQRADDSVLKKQLWYDPPATQSKNKLSQTKLDEESPQKGSVPTSSPAKTASVPRQSSQAGLVWDEPKTMLCFAILPPSADEVRKSMQVHGVPDIIYQDAYYSDEKDVPPRPREYAGHEFRLESNTLPFLPDFDPAGQSPATFGVKPELGSSERRKADAVLYRQQSARCGLRGWEIADPPPSFDEVQGWWIQKLQKQNESAQNKQSTAGVVATQKQSSHHQSQVEGPTPKNKHGFKYSQKRKSTSVQHEAQYMSTMTLEIHVNTRGKLVPNPEEDEVKCIFWCVKSDEDFGLTSQSASDNTFAGVVVLSEDGTLAQRIRSMTSIDVVEETSELDVMVRMVELVRTYDPDVLTGYEVHGGSWGYLIERARFKYEYDLCDEFSRMKSLSHGRIGRDADRWGFNTTSTIRVTGRHMINIWRAMRGELNLLQYTMENVVWHLLHRRIPHYSYKDLTEWFTSGRVADLDKVIRYHLIRTRLDMEILETNELIPRTSEQARLLGVDFFSVFSRGSQYKVESIMFRIAKPENFLLVSPSRKQVGGQNALECLPLVMEPQSAFYTSPLLVLDFQSLYPSVMIAYNYCYSTFLGRIVNWRGTNKMGFTEYKRREGLLKLLREHINIAPNGMMYTKAGIRKSLLAKMLTEILETRVMVKSGMKQDKDDRTLQQLLNHRQLALKLLANVTYGYTSASFSGRMPCSEIADSIVQTGRETLERAIAYIHSVDHWDAEVVYGDTDSLFVYLKGRTRDQAFKIGEEIAKAITDMNPRPIKLKFEKVYHPCVLLAKKRYVGYKYEHPAQAQPEFDAKGIETVRRDGTPAEQKIEEKALKLLFETADLSEVKAYFQAQCAKIMQGNVSVQDFCFAKEVKLGTYSDKGPPPPGALISTKRMLEDARAEPQYGERVPYVVVSGGPGARLIDRCVAPEDLLHDPNSSLDAEYYISKNLIPPLERIFNLVGANVRQWYDEMPKVQRIRRVDAAVVAGTVAAGAGSGSGWKKKTLEAYLKSASCAVCGVKMHKESIGMVCSRCKSDTAGSMVQVQRRLNADEKRLKDALKVCQTCAGLPPLDADVRCDSKDCPVFYSRTKLVSKVRTERSIVESVLSELDDPDSGLQNLEW
jgi:DNA polymerase zeta